MSALASRSVDVHGPFGQLHAMLFDPPAPADDAPPVVIWPSVFSTAAVQQRLVERLATGAPVLAVDPPGHGGSRLDRPYALTMRACAETSLALLDEVGGQSRVGVRWVGTSWGGLVGVEAALLAPERFNHLACLNTPFAFRRPRPARPTLLPTAARLMGTSPFFANRVAGTFFLPATRSGDRTAAAMAAHRSTFTDGDRRQLSSAARLIFVDRDDARPVLPSVTVPTLVVAGAHDRSCTVAMQREAAGLLPHGRFAVVDSAHIAAVDATDAVVVELRDAWSPDSVEEYRRS